MEYQNGLRFCSIFLAFTVIVSIVLIGARGGNFEYEIGIYSKTFETDYLTEYEFTTTIEPTTTMITTTVTTTTVTIINTTTPSAAVQASSEKTEVDQFLLDTEQLKSTSYIISSRE